jgi:hypothetical protein
LIRGILGTVIRLGIFTWPDRSEVALSGRTIATDIEGGGSSIVLEDESTLCDGSMSGEVS